MTIGTAEKEFCVDGIMAGIRHDGRSLHDLRTIIVTPSILPLSHGSAQVNNILCSVKAELVQQSSTLLQTKQQQPSSSVFELHVPQGTSARDKLVLQNLLDTIHYPTSLDTLVWRFYIDVWYDDDTDNDETVVIDHVWVCIRYALYDTQLPQLTLHETNDDSVQNNANVLDRLVLSNAKSVNFQDNHLMHLPQLLTVYVVRKDAATKLLLDANGEERAVSHATLHVGLVPNNNNNNNKTNETANTNTIVLVQQFGTIPLSLLQTALTLAQTHEYKVRTTVTNNNNENGPWKASRTIVIQ